MDASKYCFFFFLRDIVYENPSFLGIIDAIYFDVNHFSYRRFSYFCFWCRLFCEFWL